MAQRFLALRVAGLVQDAPRPGRTASISAEEIRAIVKATVQTKPCYATRWEYPAYGAGPRVSPRQRSGGSGSSHNLAPHLVKPDKPSATSTGSRTR